MNSGGPELVVFDAADVSPAVDLIRRFASPPNETRRWIQVEPIDVPDHVLPEVSGFLGRKKRADVPTFQIIYTEPSERSEQSVLNIEARGLAIADAARASGLEPPTGFAIGGNKHALLAAGDAGSEPEPLLRYAIQVVQALLSGWSGRFEALGVDSTG